MSGTYPYFDGYLQLGGGADRSYGIGVRGGIPTSSWNEHSLYGRIDRPAGRHRRLLLNPGLFYHGGNSPNGANPGSFIALSQGIGLLFEGAGTSFTPGVTFVLGRLDRSSYGQLVAAKWAGFAVLSGSVMFRRRRYH